jgi:hypothetical protein
VAIFDVSSADKRRWKRGRHLRSSAFIGGLFAFVLAAVAQDTPAPSAEERARIVEQSREIALA